MNTGSCSALERVLLPKRRASCQTRTHETAMSTVSVWSIDLGDAVTEVTRRRDGFRHSSDERSNAAAAVCCSRWRGNAQGGANNLRSRPARYDDFLCGQLRIRGDSQLCRTPPFSQRFFSCFWRMPEPNQPNPGTALVPARRRRQGWRAGWFARGTVGVKQIQHSADPPISHRNPEGECRNDGEQEQDREQKRRHIVLFFRCAGTHGMIPRISLSGSNPGRRAMIYSDNVTLPRIDVSRCWRLRYVSRIAFPLSRTFQSSASG